MVCAGVCSQQGGTIRLCELVRELVRAWDIRVVRRGVHSLIAVNIEHFSLVCSAEEAVIARRFDQLIVLPVTSFRKAQGFLCLMTAMNR